MVQPQTRLKVADNTGAKEIMCIRVLGGSHKQLLAEQLKRVMLLKQLSLELLKKFAEKMVHQSDLMTMLQLSLITKSNQKVLVYSGLSLGNFVTRDI